MKKLLLCFASLLLFLSCIGTDGEKNSGLPPEGYGLDERVYGVITLSVSNMRRTNNFSSEMVSQALSGMPVKLLRKDNWYHIRTPEGYTGWVHPSSIVAMTKEQLADWNRAEKVIVTSHYGFTYEEPDVNCLPVSDVVAGNRFVCEGIEGDFYKIAYPDKRIAYIPNTISSMEKEWRNGLKQDAESIIRTAYSLTGVPYLWAGTSSKGVDCSGFVRTVLYMHDIIIPRDAYQQASIGERIYIDDDFSNLQHGDLLFFGQKAEGERKERVVHVGIYVGNKRFIHSQGYVQTGSLDPSDKAFDEYNRNRLLYASRILHLIDKAPEITTTLTNDYYNRK